MTTSVESGVFWFHTYCPRENPFINCSSCILNSPVTSRLNAFQSQQVCCSDRGYVSFCAI
ncbi:uncharacterized protein CLUP02_02814 [Colletotrichum lupini]|uniref:Uncharacterized protein n=1 Tax=Colletotrichum lupini TaxID=145971 RepID=A0A9Q8WBQ1_9PEZI|nr:uncharacterized protein CLUP02_02814 [Colletotrichum lupini]KAK1701839.1 hypothetical protein BDP67DRAFT_293958 [Colletotrichum lupini]UQC77346.1 hypothetical protein CLUP02_02814 [Colletotrichum lupini]